MDLTMLILQAGPLSLFIENLPASLSYTGMYGHESCIPPSHTVLSRSSPTRIPRTKAPQRPRDDNELY